MKSKLIAFHPVLPEAEIADVNECDQVIGSSFPAEEGSPKDVENH